MSQDQESTGNLRRTDRRTLVLMLVIFATGFALRAGSVATVQGVYSGTYSQPYMYDMDSYYNLRLASNLLDHQALSEDGWDRYSYYPPGVPLNYPPLLAYLTILVYMILSPLTGLTDLAFWLPAFIAPLAGVLVFALARSLECDDLSSAAAGFLAVSVPFYFMRTVPGFYDTDMFNLVLPLAVVLSLHLSVEKGSWRHAVFGGALMALYSAAWNGWQILYCILAASVILSRSLRRREPIIFLLVSTALIEVIAPGSIPSILSGALRIPEGVSSAYPFPNPYANITELQRPGPADAVMALGPGLLLAGTAGFGALIRDHRKGLMLPLLTLWTVTGAVSMLWGIRFSEVAAVPLPVTSALFLNEIRRTEITAGFMDLSDPKFRKALHVAVAAMVVLPSFLICIDSYSALHPRVNDDLMAAAHYIRENTSSGTVVICNWVHGHFFAFMAERPVNFDGRLAYIETIPWRGSDYPLDPRVPGVYREYWQDRALATSDPVLSAEILSMLASSGDDAYLEVLKNENDSAASALILGDVLGVKSAERADYLMERYGFHEDAAKNLASILKRKSDYVLVTYDRLIDKGYWILYYGSWNFTGKTEEPLYSTGTILSIEPLRSSDGLLYDDGSVKFNGMNVSRLYLVNGTSEIIEGDPDSDIVAFALLARNRTVVLQREYERSMFVRLVILGDGGGVFRAVMRSGDVTVWEPVIRKFEK
ncbi:STT3 domain-containing protein [Methanothermobacter sp.]|uniref:STT3 domain-containing protein n=1 Tax=Methanothermobacter sp. TaxID=1884223 RepID=UPI003C73EB2E